jgi:hypothetical protein
MSNEPTVTDIKTAETAAGGVVTAVTVSITVNAKVLGADAFVKMEEIRWFDGGTDPANAILVREDIIGILREQVLDEAAATADAVRERAAQTPKGAVSVHPAAPVQPAAGAQFGQTAPPSGPQATVAVANGAAPAAGQWQSVPSRFGDGEIRFLPTSVYSTGQLEAEVAQWLSGQGLNPDAFKVWDNRPGPKGLEAGAPNGCVAAIKVSRDAEDFVPADVARNAVARVKFNNNGTLYIWLTKEAEAAIKYGALDKVKLAAGNAAPEEEAF